MNAPKHKNHKNTHKGPPRRDTRALNEDYYINCHKASTKTSFPARLTHSSKSNPSKLKPRSLTHTPEPHPYNYRSNNKIKAA